MSSKAHFTKGEMVWTVGRYNHTMKWYAKPARVEGCGKVRMVLMRRDSDECLGREFRPTEDQHGYINPAASTSQYAQPIGYVQKGEELDVTRLEERANAVREYEIAMWERQIERNTSGPRHEEFLRGKIAEMRAATFEIVTR